METCARLLVKVAQLYHLQGLNQDQIARQLGISRSKVSRSLKQARERGIVEITIHAPTQFSLELERQLETEFALREAVVVNSGSVVGNDTVEAVAIAAADYVLRVLKPGDVLGVSGGETMARMAQAIPAGAVKGVTVAQLGAAAAYPSRVPTYSGREVAWQLASKLGSLNRLVLVPVPSLLDSEAIRDALLTDTGVRQAISLLGDCSVAAVGVGVLDPPSRTFESLRLTAEEKAQLEGQGAIGEICSRVFDANGRPCSSVRQLVGLSLEQMRAIPLVIGVACRKYKAPAILGALRGGYLKVLITDDATASALLELARSANVRDGGEAHEGSPVLSRS